MTQPEMDTSAPWYAKIKSEPRITVLDLKAFFIFASWLSCLGSFWTLGEEFCRDAVRSIGVSSAWLDSAS